MKTEIITPKIANDKDDAFWYYGCEIAIIEFNNRKLIVESRGEIRVQFDENGEVFRNDRAIEEAEDRNFNDMSLIGISDFDGFHNNNWFVICELDTTNNIGDDLEISHSYDEARKGAEEMIKGDF